MLDIEKMIDELTGPAFMAVSPKNPFGMLKVDVVEDDNCYVIHADVPGYDKDNISIEVTDGMLKISVSANENSEKKATGYIRRECFRGKMSRSIRVGDDINVEAIKASLDKGILTVSVPKKAEPEKDIKTIYID